MINSFQFLLISFDIYISINYLHIFFFYRKFQSMDKIEDIKKD